MSPSSSTATASPTTHRDQRRMLRVGIVHGRHIVEERLLARPGDVTIGTSPRSTFIVPWDRVPERWRLFEERGGRRFLRLAGDMSARIAEGAIVTSVDARDDGSGGAARPIPLSDQARGKVTVGDTTVLFQLLRPPPPQPRPRLPRSVRRRVGAELDRWFTAVLGLTALLHVAVVVYLRQVDWPRRPDIEAIPDRFVHQIVHAPRPTPPPVAPTTIAEETPRPAPRPHAPTGSPRPLHPAPRNPDSFDPSIARIGLIPLLTARGPDGKSAIDDVLSGGSVDRSLDEALRDVGAVAIASNESLHGLRPPGSGQGKIATPADLRPGKGIADATPTGPVGERDVSSRLKVDPPIIEGGHADLASITREIRTRRKAIAACYERALKTRPTLAGKLVVRFSITAAGTISTVDIDDDTLGAPEVGACVRAIVQRWRFAPPSEAPVELSFPFVFQAGS
jgi:TonB family protein